MLGTAGRSGQGLGKKLSDYATWTIRNNLKKSFASCRLPLTVFEKLTNLELSTLGQRVFFFSCSRMFRSHAWQLNMFFLATFRFFLSPQKLRFADFPSNARNAQTQTAIETIRMRQNWSHVTPISPVDEKKLRSIFLILRIQPEPENALFLDSINLCVHDMACRSGMRSKKFADLKSSKSSTSQPEKLN